MLPHDVAVGHRREVGEEHGRGRPGRSEPGRAGSGQRRQADREHVLERRHVGTGDAVARGGLLHGRPQRGGCRLVDVVPRRLAEATGIGPADRGKDVGRVPGVERSEGIRDVNAALRGQRQGRAEQEDAEIGVLADSLHRRLDPAEHTGAEPRPGPRQMGRRDSGARDEIRDDHAVAGGEGVDIAGLERIELGQTARFVRRRDDGRRQAHATTRRGGLAARTAPRKPRATASAMSTSVTFCRPDQAGMELTSRTR